MTPFAKPVEIVHAIVSLAAAESSRAVAVVSVSGGYRHVAEVLVDDVMERSQPIASHAVRPSLCPLAESIFAVVYLFTPRFPLRRSTAHVSPWRVTSHALLFVDIEQLATIKQEWGERILASRVRRVWELVSALPLMAFYGVTIYSGKFHHNLLWRYLYPQHRRMTPRPRRPTLRKWEPITRPSRSLGAVTRSS